MYAGNGLKDSMSDTIRSSTSTIIPLSPSLEDLQRAALDNLPMAVGVYEIVNRTTYLLRMVNRPFYALYNATEADVLGKYLNELVPPATATQLMQRFQTCLDTGEAITVEDSYEVDVIGMIWTISRFAPIRASHGEYTHLLIIWEDITERKRRELEVEQTQRRIIEQQAAQLNELSTPLLAVSDTAVVMPLIGTIDEQRVQQMMESLLVGVSNRRATIVILDITGVPIVDTHVANALIRASQSVRLLGARVILTGIRPEVAQTLVGLGVDLSSIITRATLRDGIAYALR